MGDIDVEAWKQRILLMDNGKIGRSFYQPQPQPQPQ